MRNVLKKVIGLETTFADPHKDVRPVEGFDANEEPRVAVLATTDKLSQQWAPRWLEHVGLQVEIARSAEEAHEAVASHCPDLILCDAALRSDNGALLIESLRLVHEIDIPVVALCANSGEVVTAADRNAEEVVRRPYDWQVITQRVVRVIKAHETAAELNEVRSQFERLNDSTRAAERTRAKNVGIDELSGLPNSDQFRRLSQKAMSGTAESCDSSLVVIGLDRFRHINDAIGRENANQLLRGFAKRLKKSIADREVIGFADAGTVTAIAGRLGGARFGVHLNSSGEHQVDSLLTSIQRKLEDPFEVDGQSIYLTASFGIASQCEFVQRADDLLDAAEAAMFKAQDDGVDTHTFDPQQDIRATNVLRLDTMLRDALRNNEFSLHYQPILDSGLGEVVAAEALLRWDHPVDGRVSPEVFVPIAENTGVMTEIGNYVIREACAQLRRWLDNGIPPIRIAINLSMCQLTRGDVVSVIRSALDANELPASLLEIELSERGVLNCKSDIVDEIHRLKELGVRISIDDFGTGQAAIAYLKDLPIDVIKIDRSYVSGASRNSRDEAIASGMVALARRLNATVIAEGVETGEQLEMLRDWGSHECQGFYFSGAVDGAEFAASFGSVGDV